MRRLSSVLLLLAALAVPALLALGVHLAAGSSLTAPPPLVARVSTDPIAAPSVPPSGTETSGPCDEAEHRNDPRCRTTTIPGTTTTTDDRSGSNSGSESSGKGRGRGRSGGDD
jgi:hypothetical protein